jgi:hypothetical protein
MASKETATRVAKRAADKREEDKKRKTLKGMRVMMRRVV